LVKRLPVSKESGTGLHCPVCGAKLGDIRNLIGGISKIGDTPMFMETTYIHPQNGQEYPMFVMNRDGFTLLAMGFTRDRALQFKLDYIAAFNRMEQVIQSGGYLVPHSFSEALKLELRQKESE
jgi:phage regulatory protein, rha family